MNTNKITIRGIGSRSQYSTTRVKAYFEQIPLTNTEGETTLEDIDLEAIGNIEIIKGPNSTSFGAGLGGAINLFANTAQNSFVKTSTTVGSYKLFKNTLGAGYSDNKTTINAYYNSLENEGTVNNFKFTDFIDNNNDYSGNKLPAVPDFQCNLGFDLRTNFGFNLNTNFGFFSKFPMDDANLKYTQKYQLLNAKVSYVFVILKKLKAEINVGVQNILDEKYAASILPNAVGFGATAPRYYYPGNPRNSYGGMSFIYPL